MNKIERFESKMDQLMGMVNERCNIFNGVIMNKMGLLTQFNALQNPIKVKVHHVMGLFIE